MQCVTRKIVLHKRLVYHHARKALPCAYTCFGNFDGFDTGLVLGGEKDDSLICLWEASVEEACRLERESTAQTFFMTRGQPAAEKDHRFWTDKTNLVAVSFVSMPFAMTSQELDRVMDEIERSVYLDSGGQVVDAEIICYTLLESSDFMLFVKADRFKSCDTVLNQIRENRYLDGKVRILYSYSFPCVAKEFLSDSKDLIAARFNGEMIDRAELSLAVRKDIGSILNLLQDALNRKKAGTPYQLNNTSIMGNNDIRIQIERILLGDLLMLFHKTGPLSHENQVFSEYFYNCYTKLHVNRI